MSSRFQPFRLILSLLIFSLSTSVASAADTESDKTVKEEVDLMPKFNGVVRARWEMDTHGGENRFEVRNARLMISGKIARPVDYFIQTDFCDRGKIKILDVYARVWPTEEIGLQVGQFRMPFGVDPFRAPHHYYFNNRSFIGREVCNVRAVGVKAQWAPKSLPLNLEAGAFNPNTITDHQTWHRKLSYAAKLTFNPTEHLGFATGFQSLSPDSTRINLIDGCITWKSGRWIAEGEYMYKHYGHDRHKPCHAYNAFASYWMPVKAGIFNRLSFHGRFDGMTDHSTGVRNSDGRLQTDSPGCNRLTAGATISYFHSANRFIDFRVDYEKYFYRHNAPHSLDRGDKITAELVLRF